MTQESNQPSKISIFGVLSSVFSAMFGVQSSKNRERDFVRGKPVHYLIIGLIVTVAFVLSIWGLVKLVLHLAGV